MRTTWVDLIGIGKNKMLGKVKRITTTQWLFLAGLAIGIFIAYNVVLSITRMGEIKVAINVIPKDAKVTIDNKPSSKRTVYLSAGEYSFSASAEGWQTDTQKLKVSKTSHEVYLLPVPASKKVEDLLKNNPDIQQERETLGGKRVELQNQESLEQHPVLKDLPYSQESPPFSIDFGPSKTRPGDMVFLVSDSSPNGRQAALDWIRQHGENPTDMEIVFSDFVNQLDAEQKHYE